MVIRVEWSEEDQAFVATSPDLPYASGIGPTESEAIAALRWVIEVAEDLAEVAP